MPAYRFRAIGADQRPFTGSIEAVSEQAALQELRAKGALPISLKAAAGGGLSLGGGGGQKKLGTDVEGALFGDLAVLLKAGLVLDQALDLASATIDGKANRRLAASLRDRIRTGDNLSVAMAESAVAFDPITLALVRAGEASGKLADSVARLAELAKQRQAAAEKMRSALGYPLMVLAVSGLTIVFLLLFVVPAFEPMFSGNGGAAMPDSMRRLLGARTLLVDWGAIAFTMIAVLALIFQRLARQPVMRRRIDSQLLALPWVGALIAAADIGRFSRAMGGLIEGGMPLASALPLARETLKNSKLREAIEAAGEDISAGRDLSSALADTPEIPPVVGHLMRVSEAAGEPAPMLLRIAVLCERDVQKKTERLLSMLPAVLLVGMGALVAGIVSMLLGAVLDVNQTVL